MRRLAVGILFIALPFLEVALLIKTGQRIGFWATLSLLAGAGIVGSFILSRQSLAAIRRTQEAMTRGEQPIAPVIDGLFLILAGALLIIPGLITDALALLLLVPPIRRWVAHWSVRRLAESAETHAGSFRSPAEQRSAHAHSTEGPVIEGEFERLGEQTAEPRQVKDRD